MSNVRLKKDGYRYCVVLEIGGKERREYDVTEGVEAVLAGQQRSHEASMAALRAEQAGLRERYNQIEAIILSTGAGTPTA